MARTGLHGTCIMRDYRPMIPFRQNAYRCFIRDGQWRDNVVLCRRDLVATKIDHDASCSSRFGSFSGIIWECVGFCRIEGFNKLDVVVTECWSGVGP